MSSPMIPIVKGRLYWSDKRHVWRGLILWTGRRHVRLLPLNRFRQPFSADDRQS